MPKYLEAYLNTRMDAPNHSWVDFSQYYAQLSPYFLSYMNNSVRPCVEYATGSYTKSNAHLSLNVGYAIKKAAVQLIKGEGLMFNGDDTATAFLSDIWSKKTKFGRNLGLAIDNTVVSGTSVLKTDIDAYGRVSLSTFRADRFYATVDCFGDVCECVTLVNLLTTQKSETGIDGAYWLVEHRQYKNGKPTTTFKVHTNGGIANAATMPLIYGPGLPKSALPKSVLRTVNAMGIVLNEPMMLPFKRGLGIRLLLNTAANGTVPGLTMGDPILYGSLDVLWSIDTVFCGSIIDVINGEGKILAPSRFINEVKELLEGNKIKVTETRAERWGDNDDGITYLATERDKDFPPQQIQFDIRAEKYSALLETYLKMATASAGFSPVSIFPFLTDNSTKTAHEITSYDNKTQATVSEWHRLNLPTINDALEEVLYLEGFKGRSELQLSDYIGNRIQRNEDLRRNYESGAIPHDVFIQKINGLTDAETKEYLVKIQAEQKERREAEQSKPFGGLDL